jgi:hypothetical protein
VPQFAPALGILTGISVTFAASVEGSAGVESLDAAPAVTTTNYSANITLIGPAGIAPLSVSPAISFVDSLSAFDGVIDFAGTSGILRSGIALSDSAGVSVPLTPANLATFVGNGVVNWSGMAAGNSFVTGPGNVLSQFLTRASGVVTVCYDYASDCNGNGIPDADEIAQNPNLDRYGPASCQPDADCDGDGLPNRCELAGNDCDQNQLPDNCQPDCDGNGIADAC